MNIKDSYIHNGEAILKDIQVSGSKLQKLKAGKDANDAYLTWVDVLDLSPFGASGHNHDDRYLKLIGNGTTNPLTGSIYINNVNGIVLNPNNKDLNIWEVRPNWLSTFGFNLQYAGTGIGNDNDLVLWAHNQNGTHVETYRVKQDGTFIFKAAPKVGTNVIYHAGNLTPKTITLSTTAQTYITAGNTDYTIKMPSTDPYTSARTPTAHNHSFTLGATSIITGGTCTEITGPFAVHTDASADKAFSIRRSSAGEGVKHWVDDSAYHIEYTNDEASSTIAIRIINTDIERATNKGADATDVTVYLDCYKQFYPNVSNTGSIGTSSYKWANMYATTFHGSLDGTSTYASNVGSSGTAGTNYVTAANVISMYNWYNSITSTDPASNTAIDKWNEIVSFLSGITDTSTLSGILAGYAAAGHNHDGRYLRWNGSAADVSAMAWGTLTAANGYRILSHAASSDGGDWGMTNQSGKIYMQLDGYYYQNEGQYRVTDVSETVTALGTNGNYLTWTKNGTTNSITVPYTSNAGNADNADTVDGKHASDFATAGHTHNSLVQKNMHYIKSKTYYWSLTNDTWYRIMESDSPSVKDSTGDLVIYMNNEGYPSTVKLEFGICYHSQPFINSLWSTSWSGQLIKKARIVYKRPYGNQKAYIEVLAGATTQHETTFSFKGHGWNFITPVATTEALSESLTDSSVVDIVNGNKVINRCLSVLDRLGIGTASPSYKLHVTGDIYTTTGFKKKDSNNNYVLLGGGGHKLESNLSVKYATSAGNADTVDNLHSSAFKKTWIASAGGTHVGWVTIAKWTISTPYHFSSYPFMLSIYRVYSSPSTETYTFSITFGWNTANIVQVNGNAGTRIIEKLRIAKCSDNLTYRLEMYVNTKYTTYTNQCFCVAYGNYGNDFSFNTICELSSDVSSTLAEITTAPNYIVGNLSGNASTATNVEWSGITDKPNFINSFGTKIGDITIRGGQTGNGSVNLVMSNNELQASIVGLGSNAYTSTAYLPLTGGTITGPIEISTGTLNNNYNEGLRITCAKNNWAGITFGSTGLSGAPTNGWFAALNPSDQFIISPNDSSNTTGLTLNAGGDAKWRNNVIWHAGNDGSGSGLDADLLDGVHANGLFTNFSNKTVAGNKVLAATIGGKELTVAVEYAGSAGNAIYITPQSYTPTSDTVGGHKDGLVNWLNTDSSTGIGKNIIISESIISQWDNDSAKPYSSSVYAMIKIGGGYSHSTYGQWLLSSYNQTRLGVVGRNSDVWSSIKWIAWTSDIPTKISQLTNDSGYVTSSGVTSVATGTGLTGGTITSTGTISINSTYQTYINHGESAYNSLSNYVLKKPDTHFYNYIGCNKSSNWYKVTFPFHNTTSTNPRWMMVSMELILKGNYSSGADGTIYLSYYIKYPPNNNVGSANNVYALAVGSNMNNIRIAYSKTDLGIFYVYVPNNYNSFAIQNLSANDSALSYDFTTTTIDALSSSNYPADSTIQDINIRKLYTTNGTSLLLNGNTLIDAGNIRSQSVSYADSADSVARATFGDGSNATHDANAMTSNGLYYYNSNGPTTNAHNFATSDSAMYVQAYNTSWVSQIAQDYRDGKLAVRSRNNGTWQPWRRIAFADSDYVVSADRIYYEPEHRKFTRTASGNGWNTQAYSVCGYKECRVTYKISQTNAYIMVGLNSDPTTDANYSSVDYCWYTQSGGGLEIYENGTGISSISGHTTYAAGDELIVEYSCGQVRYYHNGILCRTVARAYGSPLYFDCSFYQPGSIENVVFEPIHDGLDFAQTTATYSLSNAAWTNTIPLPNIAGSYILNITSGNSTLTGVFSIGTSDNAKDEISLHLHGNGPRLYARTNGTTLQLSSSDTNATSRSVTIKYRRMI